MNKVTLILFVILTYSCEDVITVEVPSEAPRLIVDAIIRVNPSEQFTLVTVKVSETNSFFGSIPPVGLQQITLTGLEGGFAQVLIEEEEGSGIYQRLVSTEGLIGEEIFLQIDFEDEFYVAYANFVPTVPINEIRQGDETLLDDDETEVMVSFTDFADREDYYLFDFDFNNFITAEDTFFDGQEFEFSYFYDETMLAGTTADISIIGVDKQLYDYFNLLLDQSGEFDVGAFETPAVTVRGNIINATEIDNIDFFDNVELSDNFALGYFAIVEENIVSFTFE